MGDAAHAEEFARLFAHLRVNASRIDYPDTLYRSPNKPLLLLAVLDLFAEGDVPDGRVTLGPALGELFSRYWYRVVPPDHRPNLALPFFHLHRDGGFWRLVATPGNEHALEHIQKAGQIRTVTQFSELVAYAQLDSHLVQCLAISSVREALRDVLIRTYFGPAAQAHLREQAEVNAEAYDYSNRLLAQRIVAEAQSEYDLRPVARAQGFRRAIVIAYAYRYAMCGIRVVTADGHAAVEAAHIHAWSVSHNDWPTNGLALCRLCHWSFDEGLLGADRRRVILVSPQLTAVSNVPGHLSQLARRPLISSVNSALAPSLDALGTAALTVQSHP